MLIRDKEYIFTNPTAENLKEKRFEYLYELSTPSVHLYRTSFVVMKYKDDPILECELIVKENDGRVEINVYNCSNHAIYSPFYHETEKTSQVLECVNQSIIGRFKKLGICEAGKSVTNNTEDKRKFSGKYSKKPVKKHGKKTENTVENTATETTGEAND